MYFSVSFTAAWKLQDARARFSQLVREARTHGPQVVTIHGKEAIVVVSVEEYARLRQSAAPKPSLYELLQNAPLRDVEFGEPGIRMPIRDVDL
jgi:prevent-host-death family protein